MNINSTIRILDRLYKQLCHSDLKSNTTITNSMLDLEHALLDHDFNTLDASKLFDYMSSKNILQLFQKAYEVFETNLEIDFVKSIIYKSISPQEDFMNYPLYKRFVTLIRNEITLTNIKSSDHILFIGSGPTPITAILIHQISHAKVDCVDRNIISAALSKRLISKLGYTDSIRIINKEGIDADCSQYSVILIALLAKPKDKLLKSIWNKCRKNTRIICRTSDSIRQAFYGTTASKLLDQYEVKKRITAKGNQTISSVLIIKS